VSAPHPPAPVWRNALVRWGAPKLTVIPENYFFFREETYGVIVLALLHRSEDKLSLLTETMQKQGRYTWPYVVGRYLRDRWVVYGLLSVYSLLIALKSLGLPVWTPSCPIYQTTGYKCLGCGLTHAAMDLIHLRLGEAWQHNPLIFLFVPIIFIYASFDFLKYSRKFKTQKPT